MGKNCKEILAYTDDVMDDRASDQVRICFFNIWINVRPVKVNTRFPCISGNCCAMTPLFWVMILSQAVMGRLRSVRARQKPERKKWEWKKPVFGVAACLVILAAVSIGFLSIREDPVLNTAGDEKMLSVVQDTEEGIVLQQDKRLILLCMIGFCM